MPQSEPVGAVHRRAGRDHLADDRRRVSGLSRRSRSSRRPEIIIGSWCGKKFRPEKVAARPGFERIPAIRNGAVYEIKSPIILQPGPAALTDG